MNSNVLINVATEYDNKGFKQADRGITALTKSVAKLTGTLALARRTQQAMFDAMADEKATKILAQNLKNLGMSFAIAPAEQFIATMQRQTGILDDELRPAYAQLARVTGDMYKSQQLLSLAFNVSSGTGQDFSSVVDALSQAYVGNTRGLRSLNIGLTQAELKTASFEEIITILNRQFGGAGAAALDTYAGKMAVLQAATADASETIGMSLLNSISTVSGSQSITDLADKINNLAEGLGHLIFQAGIGARALMILGGAAGNPKKALEDFKQLLKDVNTEQARWAQRNMKVWYPEGYMTPAMKKAADEAKKRAAALLAANQKITKEKKAQTAIDKANATLNKANNIFDLERIQVEAAKQNETLTANEQKRLEIKQATFALEDAIVSKDEARIVAQTNILNGLLGQFSVLQRQDIALASIKTALDALGANKDLINLANLQAAYDLLVKMNAVSGTAAKGGSVITGGGTGITTGSTFDVGSFRWRDEGNTGNQPTLPSDIGANWDLGSFRMRENSDMPAVNINVAGSVVSEGELIDKVTDAIYNFQKSGQSKFYTYAI